MSITLRDAYLGVKKEISYILWYLVHLAQELAQKIRMVLVPVDHVEVVVESELLKDSLLLKEHVQHVEEAHTM